jgi:hypothetical protein
MRRVTVPLALIWLIGMAAADSDPLRLVVADVPYATVWAAAQHALRDYPVERAADGEIVTGWRERPPTAEERGVERVTERVTLRVEAFGERITRITPIIELQGWREGRWAAIEDVGPATRALLARIRAALG